MKGKGNEKVEECNDKNQINQDFKSHSDNYLLTKNANSLGSYDDSINTDGSWILDLQHALNLLNMDPSQLLKAVNERT